METLFITRTKSSHQGTFGVAYVNSKQWWYSLELPWLDNTPQISCIPVGKYTVKWTYSPTFKKYTYQIMNVPGRGGIRIHSGNWAGLHGKYKSHSKGCPLFGTKAGILAGQMAVLGSKIAVMQFEKYFNKRTFILEVSNA